ncbi:hypothetical protein KKD19_01465 [Patescibacteria group bacterium]|nr:hypothetical protein [Patescibacteria group bacterium]MBU4511901.1 hypothetical protein [Patescibacteria group bacterium]MCG2692869.1 hypothetical protein [Candidatus Parcubacteria bacterium]
MELYEGKYVVLQVDEFAGDEHKQYEFSFESVDDPRIKATVKRLLGGDMVRESHTKVFMRLFAVEAKRIPLEYSAEPEVRIGG